MLQIYGAQSKYIFLLLGTSVWTDWCSNFVWYKLNFLVVLALKKYALQKMTGWGLTHCSMSIPCCQSGSDTVVNGIEFNVIWLIEFM